MQKLCGKRTERFEVATSSSASLNKICIRYNMKVFKLSYYDEILFKAADEEVVTSKRSFLLPHNFCILLVSKEKKPNVNCNINANIQIS